jgi:hypothetical protein
LAPIFRGDFSALRKLISYNAADVLGMMGVLDRLLERSARPDFFVAKPEFLSRPLRRWDSAAPLKALPSPERLGRSRPSFADIFVDTAHATVVGIDLTGSEAKPCGHHNLETYLHAFIYGCGLATDPKGPLFRTIGRGTDALTATPLPQANAYAMIRRRAAAADIETKIGNHTFRATGSPPISRTAARSSTHSQWRRMKATHNQAL